MDPPQETKNHEPKKKKKQKLSKLERKQLRLQAAMNLKKKLMREQLMRELELTKISLKRGKFEWEEICKEIKIKELREEVEAWSIKAEHVLRKKDQKIESLFQNIEETQEFHERNFSKHLDQLKYLTECHQTLRQTATELYELQSEEVVQDFFREVNGLKEVQDHSQLNNENIMHTVNVELAERLKRNLDQFIEQKFEKVASEIESRYIIRDKVAEKMRRLQDQLLLWIQNLQGDLIDVRKTEKYIYFMQRQKNYITESQKLNDTERLNRKIISDLQQELLKLESEYNRKLYALKLEKAYFLEQRTSIKNSIERNKKLTHEKLLKVSSESYRVIGILTKFVKYGELLLNLGACCRKYQTEKEKVLPFNDGTEDLSPDLGSEETRKIKVDLSKLLDISEGELEEQMNIFFYFWRRCSNVSFHNLLLKEEKRKLTEENEKYRNIIRSMKISDNTSEILESIQIKRF